MDCPRAGTSITALDTNVLIYAFKSLSFWDAMSVAACMECGAHCLLSEDMPSSPKLGTLEIINPFA